MVSRGAPALKHSVLKPPQQLAILTDSVCHPSICPAELCFVERQAATIALRARTSSLNIHCWWSVQNNRGLPARGPSAETADFGFRKPTPRKSSELPVQRSGEWGI